MPVAPQRETEQERQLERERKAYYGSQGEKLKDNAKNRGKRERDREKTKRKGQEKENGARERKRERGKRRLHRSLDNKIWIVSRTKRKGHRQRMTEQEGTATSNS